MDPLRIYIAGPYSSDPEPNVRQAMDAWHALADAGFVPFCPHLSHFLHLHQPRDYQEWLNHDLAWLELCHAVLRLPGESPGANRECLYAVERGIPVFDGMETLCKAYRARVSGKPSRTPKGFTDQRGVYHPPAAPQRQSAAGGDRKKALGKNFAEALSRESGEAKKQAAAHVGMSRKTADPAQNFTQGRNAEAIAEIARKRQSAAGKSRHGIQLRKNFSEAEKGEAKTQAAEHVGMSLERA